MKEEYQEIDLGKLFRVVLSKWWLILLFMVAAGGTAYYYTSEFITPIYQARSTLFIGKETDKLAGIQLSDFQIDNQLISDYQELIRTRLVTEEVIEGLALLATHNELIANIGIASIRESRFMYVTYNDYLPERAATITNYLAEVLADKAGDIVGVQNVRIVDEAIVPLQSISPSITKNVGIAAMLGAVIALGIIFLMMLMDNTIQTEEDIEKLLGAPVLGFIPAFKGEERE